MAYYEIIILVLMMGVFVLGSTVCYDLGYKKGNAYVNDKGTHSGDGIGYQRGFNEGKSAGYREYRHLEATIYERDNARAKKEQAEILENVQTLNEIREQAEPIPQEILLAYGVTKMDELPLHVRKAYNLTKTGGVVNDEATG